ncbi:MAG: hypothetical protein M1150_03820 [Patescibacteria group bacterium]|nr:hypothetical protein [Patescibacteria group bacterium]
MATEIADPMDMLKLVSLIENCDPFNFTKRGMSLDQAKVKLAELERELEVYPEGTHKYVELFRSRAPKAEQIQHWATDHYQSQYFPVKYTPWGKTPTFAGVSVRGALLDAAGPIKELRGGLFLGGVKNTMGEFTGSNSAELLDRLEKDFSKPLQTIGMTANPAFQGIWEDPEAWKHVLMAMVAYRLDGWLYKTSDGEYKEIKTIGLLLGNALPLDREILDFNEICNYLTAGHTAESIARCAHLPEFALTTTFLGSVLNRHGRRGPNFGTVPKPDGNWYRVLGAKLRGTLIEPVYWLHAACWEDLWERKMLTRRMIEEFFERYGFLGTSLNIDEAPVLPKVQTPEALAAYVATYYGWVRDLALWRARMRKWLRRADGLTRRMVDEMVVHSREITDSLVVNLRMSGSYARGIGTEEEEQAAIKRLGTQVDNQKKSIAIVYDEMSKAYRGTRGGEDEVKHHADMIRAKGIYPEAFSPKKTFSPEESFGLLYYTTARLEALVEDIKLMEIDPRILDVVSDQSAITRAALKRAWEEVEKRPRNRINLEEEAKGLVR